MDSKPFLSLSIDATRIKRDHSSTPVNFVVSEEAGYYFVGEDTSPVRVSIRKRAAYPGTYCYVSDDKLYIGYGSMDADCYAEEEYLRISIALDGTVQVERDALVTMPVYWGEAEGIFTLSNDYHFVCTELPHLDLSREGVLDALLLHTNLTTIWSQVHILGPLETLTYEKLSRVNVVRASFRPSALSRDAPLSDPHEFAALFSRHLTNFSEKFTTQKVGFIISGGLDSATLPFYLAAQHKTPLDSPATVLLYPGELGRRQDVKLRAVEQYTGLNIHRVSLEEITKKPLLDEILADEGHHAQFWSDPYSLYANQRMIDYLKSKGVEVVFGGSGGDDIMENIVENAREFEYGEKARDSRLMGEYAPHITQSAIVDFANYALIKRPATVLPLPVSVFSHTLRSNNIFIQNDIWPVSPFINPYLYAFCQGIPAYFRSNKNILRLFHKAYDFPAEIYAASQEEHFGDFYKAALTSNVHKNLLNKYTATSITAQLGYIDTTQLLSSYYGSLDLDPEVDELAMPIKSLFWIGLEIDAHLGEGRK